MEKVEEYEADFESEEEYLNHLNNKEEEEHEVDGDEEEVEVFFILMEKIMLYLTLVEKQDHREAWLREQAERGKARQRALHNRFLIIELFQNINVFAVLLVFLLLLFSSC